MATATVAVQESQQDKTVTPGLLLFLLSVIRSLEGWSAVNQFSFTSEASAG